MLKTPEWEACTKPEKNDTLRWNEPIWAAPNKPRGKPDKIGEQEIIAQLLSIEDVLTFTVISVKKIGTGSALPKVKENDTIKRKRSTLEKGACHKRVA